MNAKVSRLVRVGALIGLSLLAGCSGGRSFIPGAKSEEELARIRAEFAVVAVCPQVSVRDGTQVHAVHTRGGENNPDALRYQATVTKMARECHTDAAGTTTIKVGVAGRVIAGPKADSAPISLPLRVVVLRGGSEVLYSQLFKVPASLAGGAGNALWIQVVDGISIPKEKSTGTVEILVGFDDGVK
jgi:hypothetical protein